MPVDAQTEALLKMMSAMPSPDLKSAPVEEVRAGFNAGSRPRGEETPVAGVIDRKIPGPAGEIPVRIYTPEGAGPHPVVVYFHGGGFVLCDLDTHDGTARLLCQGAGAVVVSVDYRLAPEAKFPAGPEDCYAATCWVAENAASLGADPQRLAVGGDSAGGNFAAVVALMARERSGPAIAFQLLIYPVTSYGFEEASYAENGQGYFLTLELMEWFWGHYLSDPKEADDWRAAPLRAKDLSGLPPAFVLTAEFDPLRDEGIAYAERLREAGVACEDKLYPGVIHGFFGMGALIDRANEAVDDACRALRGAFGTAAS